MLTYYRLLTFIMPQVLQELVDSPLSTFFKSELNKESLCYIIIEIFSQ